MDFKNISIGALILKSVNESSIDIHRICNFMKQSEQDIKKMYLMKSMDTEVLLRWSKLLEYDFFRIYTQHLILYAPPASAQNNKSQGKRNSAIPQFRKNIYTKEIIDFILEMVYTGEKTKLQIIHEYGIPKSTLNKWIIKFSS